MKVDFSGINIKDILGKLSILKNNLWLAASIVITLIAIGLFVPAKLLSDNLKKAVTQTSVRTGTALKREAKGAVPKDQWKEAAKLEAAYRKDANEIVTLSLESTQRDLLSYGIFPEPNDTSLLIFRQFGEEYRAGIDNLLSRIGANDCPTVAELNQGMINATGGSPGRGKGVRPVGITGINNAFLDEGQKSSGGGIESEIVDEICLSRAQSTKVYINPSVLAGYEFWAEYKYDVKRSDAIQDCWFHQLGFWIIEDVLSTVGSMVSGSDNVLTSPVKRVMAVDFKNHRASESLLPGKTSKNPTDTRASYVTLADPGQDKANSTGRISDDAIDVVHFNVWVIVSAQSVLPFIEELCSGKAHLFHGFFGEYPQAKSFRHNQITVLESRFNPVDLKSPTHALYRYGQDSVVQLELVCEYIFNSKAYDAIKPKEVKGEDATGDVRGR
ncbi:MAG: hypothetical protein JW720_15385 [Sedimentisphaerales bacterium]|nr:hypothetical protein [Sedimentisphaerales bacterium]